jgi:hypothetical protein
MSKVAAVEAETRHENRCAMPRRLCGNTSVLGGGANG